MPAWKEPPAEEKPEEKDKREEEQREKDRADKAADHVVAKERALDRATRDPAAGLADRRDLTCDYVGHMPMAKDYGRLRMYRLRRVGSPVDAV